MRKDNRLRPAEVARILGINTETVRDFERRGLLKGYRDANGERRYVLSDVLDLKDITIELERRAGKLAVELVKLILKEKIEAETDSNEHES
jgi:DNA-binding transcriptional MerR regulator